MLGVARWGNARYHERSNGAQLRDHLSRLVKPTHVGVAGGEIAIWGGEARIVLGREKQPR
jgi:hypothetical protein